MQDIHRELNDLAISSARAIQSKETGFIHSYHGKIEPPHQAVSVEDNFLFALALCRLKTVEAVHEGKKLLERLLAYQSDEGLFPVYLHEFPFCFDRHHGAALLPSLYAIDRYFHHVLGSELSQRVKLTIDKILEVSLKELSQMSVSHQFRVGKEGDLECLITPKQLGEAFSGALFLGNNAEALLSRMKGFWHPELAIFAGPFEQMNFVKGQNELTLYELYMIAEMGKIPDRMRHLNFLKAALVLPHELKSTPFSPSCCHFGKKSCFSWRGRAYPFAFQWGEGAHLILYTQEKVSFDREGTLQIQMETAPTFDSKDSGREIFWYFTPTPEMKIRVNGIAATTFRAQDQVTLEDDKVKIKLIFETTQGRFQGHLSKASAPTEQENFGKNRFEAYDWQLLFRTIERPNSCLVTVHFSYVEKD